MYLLLNYFIQTWQKYWNILRYEILKAVWLQLSELKQKTILDSYWSFPWLSNFRAAAIFKKKKNILLFFLACASWTTRQEPSNRQMWMTKADYVFNLFHETCRDEKHQTLPFLSDIISSVSRWQADATFPLNVSDRTYWRKSWQQLSGTAQDHTQTSVLFLR